MSLTSWLPEILNSKYERKNILSNFLTYSDDVAEFKKNNSYQWTITHKVIQTYFVYYKTYPPRTHATIHFTRCIQDAFQRIQASHSSSFGSDNARYVEQYQKIMSSALTRENKMQHSVLNVIAIVKLVCM